MGTAQQDLEFRLIQTPDEKDLSKIPLNALVDEPWISEKNPKYPLELVIALRKEANVEKIQLLCHNSLIAQKIDIAAGKSQGGKKEQWKALGTVSLKAVKSSETKHELKTVYLDEICDAVKLTLHKNYEHKTNNPDNQVGLVQLRLLGRPLAMAKESDAFKYVTASEKKKSRTFGEAMDGKERRTIDHTYSDEIGVLLQSVAKSKEKAAADFQLAKAAQQSLKTLSKAKKEMEELEGDQAEAVGDEDFDRAHAIRQEMKSFRSSVLGAVDPRLIEDSPPSDPSPSSSSSTSSSKSSKKTERDGSGVYRPKELFDNINIYPPPHPKLFEPVPISPTEKTPPADLFLLPPSLPPPKLKRDRPIINSATPSVKSTKSTSSSSTQTSTPRPPSLTKRTPSPKTFRSPSPSMLKPSSADRKPSPKRLSPIPPSPSITPTSPNDGGLRGILRRPASVERSREREREHSAHRAVTLRTPSPTFSFASSVSSSTKSGKRKPSSAIRSSSFSLPSASSSSSTGGRNLFLEKENMIVPAVLRRQADIERENMEKAEKERHEREARERARRNEQSVKYGGYESDESWY